MTIRAKFISVFCISFLLVISTAIFNIYTAKKENDFMRHLSLVQAEHMAIMNMERDVLHQIKGAIDAYVLHQSPTNEELMEASDKVRDNLNQVYSIISAQIENMRTEEVIEVERHEMEIAESMQAVLDDLLTQVDSMREHSAAGGSQLEGKKFAIKASELFDKRFLPLVNQWLRLEEEETKEMREAFLHAVRQHNTMLVGSVVLCFLFISILTQPLIININTRLLNLIEGTKRISSGNLQTPIKISGNDELTVLSNLFNSMMRRLSNTQKVIIEQSYYSGRAELVSGVLHNIKNAFSPFVVDVELIQNRLDKLKLENFQMAVNEFTHGDINEERRKDLLDYIELSFLDLEKQKEEISHALGDMTERIHVIEKVLETQRDYAYADRPMEYVNLREVIDDSLALVNRKVLEKFPVSIDPGIDKLPPITTQRVVVVQVFANVITNAIESILKTNSESGEVRIDGSSEIIDGEEMVHLRIIDTGAGIANDKLLMIFQTNFSDKQKKSGLGLHWCANSLVALGGRMYAESEGPGQGASIHMLMKVKGERLLDNKDLRQS